MAAAATAAAAAAIMVNPAELGEVVGNYRLGAKIGAGSFGEIYVAVDIETGEKYAAKLEPLHTKNPQLFYEYKVYKGIKKGMGVPKVFYYGVTATHSVMIMDLLGQSLEGLFNICSRNFSMKTILMLAIQLIDRIEYLHGNCFLHRDIKPDNFLIGVKPTDSHVVYMVDLGLCKRYRDAVSKRHIPARNNKKLTGTPRYASIHTHNGCEQGRRDDLESLGYLLVYLSRGTLPWQGLKAADKQEKYDKIGKKKQEVSIDELCEDIPVEFATYLKYCCKLAFTEKPDYLFLKSLFDSLFRKQGYEYDWVYDWDDLAAHEIYIQRLQASKLRHSPSEIGLKQIRQQIEELKKERDQYKAKCEQQEVLINELKGQIRPTPANGTKQSLSESTDSAPLQRKRKRATRSKRL